ncbi:MAG: protein kinase [Candidatus Nanopelagicales bacterium]
MAYSDYVPGDVLGSGGFGDVYRALDTRHDRTVALKVYRVVLGPEAETEFHRECRASGRVSEHPSVVTILDSGVTDDNRGFLVFEFIEDGNLTTHIAKHGSIEPTLSLAWAIQLADALAFAHQQNIWHRDIKPDNVLIEHNRALLADFGIAKLIDGTATSTGGGYTPIFAAPERVIDEAQSAQCDLYSLGVTLWYMCTGKLPLGLDPTTPAVKAALHAREHPAPTLTDTTLPEPFRQLITSLLQPDPANRTTTANQVLAQLHACTGWIEQQARQAEQAQRDLERQQAQRSRLETAHALKRAEHAEAQAQEARQALETFQRHAKQPAKSPKQAVRPLGSTKPATPKTQPPGLPSEAPRPTGRAAVFDQDNADPALPEDSSNEDSHLAAWEQWRQATSDSSEADRGDQPINHWPPVDHLTSGRSVLLTVAIAAATAVLVWIGVRWLQDPSQPPQSETVQRATTSAVSPSSIAAPTSVPPNELNVTIANASGNGGSAGSAAEQLKGSGYSKVAALSGDRGQPTRVLFEPGFEGDARGVATVLGLDATLVEPRPPEVAIEAAGKAAMVIVVLGDGFDPDNLGAEPVVPTTAVG